MTLVAVLVGGSNENPNSLLREYFPKSTNLSRHSPERLASVAQEINARPRKCLNWRTPAEALEELLLTPKQPPCVATPSSPEAVSLKRVLSRLDLRLLREKLSGDQQRIR